MKSIAVKIDNVWQKWQMEDPAMNREIVRVVNVGIPRLNMVNAASRVMQAND